MLTRERVVIISYYHLQLEEQQQCRQQQLLQEQKVQHSAQWKWQHEPEHQHQLEAQIATSNMACKARRVMIDILMSGCYRHCTRSWRHSIAIMSMASPQHARGSWNTALPGPALPCSCPLSGPFTTISSIPLLSSPCIISIILFRCGLLRGLVKATSKLKAPSRSIAFQLAVCDFRWPSQSWTANQPGGDYADQRNARYCH